jgi:hypothetical protein
VGLMLVLVAVPNPHGGTVARWSRAR